MSKEEDWNNTNKIDARTRLALKLLFFIFKILSPYRFGTTFEKEIIALQAEMDKL